LDDAGSRFESWGETVDRAISHQRWLWERAKGGRLNAREIGELAELRALMAQRKGMLAGRTMWLGGTEIVKRREASSFNCAGARVQAVHDVVDIFWLLLQGAGTGFKPEIGTLSGFSRRMAVETIRSARTDSDGATDNAETWDAESGIWTIRVGDSAEAWAKAAGKLIVGRYPAAKLVLDYSQIRPAGSRLKGYGWICSGDNNLAIAFAAIAAIRNKRVGKRLTKMDLLDTVNWLGTVLSTRRSAQCALMDYGDPETEAFATAKPPGYWEANPQRAQSNNGLMFWEKPSAREIRRLFDMMVDHGGGEPSFNNAAEARRRAPWFHIYNPCFEINLTDKGFCNLVELNVARFVDDDRAMHEAARLLARANYRQTLVNLRDGILQSAWHENNEFLRLCGVGLTGIVSRPDMDGYSFRQLRNSAIAGAYSMADELGLERPKNVTCVKPSGCRPWYALTTTTDGLLTLQEMFTDHEDGKDWSRMSRAISAIHGPGAARPIVKTYVNGVAPVYRVTMSYGLTVESTGNHPWFVRQHYATKKHNKPKIDVNDWVRTDQLRPDDIIEVALGVYDKMTPSEFRSIPTTAIRMRGDHLKIEQPARMTEDLAWLIGYLWGDGAQSPAKYRLRFVDERRTTLEKVARILMDNFGLASKVSPMTDRNAFNIELGSIALWHWLQKNGVIKYEVDDPDDLALIPLVVRSSSRDHVIAFLAGLLDSDGCAHVVDDDRKNLTWTTANRRFAQHVQDVAWAVGLGVGRSLNDVGKNHQGTREMYLMTLGLNVTPEAFRVISANSVKVALIEEAAPDLDWNFHRSPSNRRVVGKVISVEMIGEMPTYDVEVDRDHWFYAGAVKSHNTLSKVMDCPEGAHKPLGRYVFNNVQFSVHDPLLSMLADANYRIFDHPTDSSARIATLPVSWPNVPFSDVKGVPLNDESAIVQLERYRALQRDWSDQNTSITVSYDPSEVPAMVKWFDKNWDNYVGVSFLFRNDPTKTAADLGFAYLPQQIVTRETYEDYVSGLKSIDIDAVSEDGFMEIDAGAECAGGACPVR